MKKARHGPLPHYRIVARQQREQQKRETIAILWTIAAILTPTIPLGAIISALQ